MSRNWPEWCYPANLVTELRLLAIPATLWAVLRREYGWALLFFVAAGVSDGVDGWLARRFHQQSTLGGYLDPLADKGLLSAMFIALALTGVLPWALTILVFTRDGCILTSALVIYLATGFKDFRPIWFGKATTTAELLTIGFALLQARVRNPVVMGIEIFGWVSVTFFSQVSGILYAFTCAARYRERQASGLSASRAPAS